MFWKAKAAAFRILGWLPLGSQIHFLLQKKLTREWPRRKATLQGHYLRAQDILADYRRYGARAPSESTFLEIGAGRDLSFALALVYSGVGRVVCVDIEPLARLDLVQHAAQAIADVAKVSPLRITSWEDLRQAGVEYRAPKNVVSSDLPDATVDCFYTNETLEHIPTEALSDIFRAAHKLLRPDGITIHFVDYGDHYTRSDSQLSRFNFLTFSDRSWSKFNSKFQFLNRLRHPEYLEMMRSAGFETLEVKAEQKDVEPEIFAKVDSKFRRFDPKEIFTLEAKIVAKPV